MRWCVYRLLGRARRAPRAPSRSPSPAFGVLVPHACPPATRLADRLDGAVPFRLFSSGLSDAFWGVTTIRAHARYVQQNVFDSVGMSSTFTHRDMDSLAYPFPAVAPGWNSGDLSTMSGCAGWHLWVDDLLLVMAAFRRRGFIVEPGVAQTMLDRQFGIDVWTDTNLGRIHAKGGFWRFKDGEFVEQSCVFFLPKGMELVILANSPLCKPETGVMGQVSPSRTSVAHPAGKAS